MTKWIITSGIITTLVIGSLIYVARPELLEQNVHDIEAPIKRIIQSQKDEKMAAAKEQAFAAWMRKYPLTADCIRPQGGLKELECKNNDDVAKAGFERTWRKRIASGWQPE